MGVAKENPRDDMRTVPIHDLIKQIRRIRKRVRAIPPGKHVSQDPHPLLSILGGLELVDQEGECAGAVRTGRVDEIEVVLAVPEISVQGDNAQAVVVLDGVGCVVEFGLRGGGRVDPAVVLPEGRDMVVIPTELLAERAGEGMWAVNGFGVRVVVAEDGEDGAIDVVFEHFENGRLGVFDECTRELVLRVVGNQVSCVDGPAEAIFSGHACQWTDCLEGSRAQIIRGVTFVGSVKGRRERDLPLWQAGI